MARVFLIFFFLLLLSAQYAYACIGSGPAPDELLPFIERADVAFVGSVVSVDGNNVVFKAEKGIKNIKDGDNYSAVMGQYGLSCLMPEVGQVWLYYHFPSEPSGPLPRPIAAGPPQGGIYLRDQYGRYYMDDEIAMVKDKLGFDLYNAKIPTLKLKKRE